jgi:energy-coupling factor transport system permease protein
MVIAVIINPLFNHQGTNILGYIGNNPITAEVASYGIAAAMMVGGVVLWFYCYNEIITSDKFTYLFGKVVPALSLVISLVLYFAPRYITQIIKISEAQKGIYDVTEKKWKARVRCGAMILSAMTAWAFERAIITSDSMKSRGYGLKGRTAYSIFRMDSHDKILVFSAVCAMTFVVIAMITGVIEIRFFPLIKMNETAALSGIVYFVYAMICAMPLLLNLYQALIWCNIRRVGK